jgi:hypothetical protein
MKKFLLLVIIISIFFGCDTDARVASSNLSKAADQFEIYRRVVFYNGITDQYILSIEGFCSVEFFTNKFTVTVKTGPNSYKKHYLGRSDNVFPFVEQLESADVSAYHYRVIFKPQSIIPDIDLKIK